MKSQNTSSKNKEGFTISFGQAIMFTLSLFIVLTVVLYVSIGLQNDIISRKELELTCHRYFGNDAHYYDSTLLIPTTEFRCIKELKPADSLVGAYNLIRSKP